MPALTPTRSPGRSHRRPRRRSLRAATAGCCALLLLLTAGCADFSSEASTFTVQPTLTARAAVPETDPNQPPTSQPPPSSSPSPDTSGSPPPDPCAPTDPAVIATCLSAPFGLAPLPDGRSALVGERTTGRILQVAASTQPVLVAQIDGIDPAGDGGLLGIALSPSYSEDGLIYAYVTTATDNRIVRIARGDTPKAIFTGIPKGTEHNGGRIAFGSDRMLYVGTGDTANPAAITDPASLAGKVLRLDEFGKPAETNPLPDSAIFASGFTQIAGICPLDDGRMAALDQRATEDLLLPLSAGKNYTDVADGEALWTWTAADGGASDCSITAGLLANTSLDLQQLTVIQFGAGGTFTGAPTVLLDDRYGRLLTVTGDNNGLFWLTTSNKDGLGTPVPSDDRVVVIPAGSAGGEGGPD